MIHMQLKQRQRLLIMFIPQMEQESKCFVGMKCRIQLYKPAIKEGMHWFRKQQEFLLARRNIIAILMLGIEHLLLIRIG